jgi:hypothetical protein
MKKLWILALVVACGATSPSITAIQFKLDPSTCFDMGTPNLGVQLWVDEVLRAHDTLSIGELSKAVPVEPGQHTAFAREESIGYGPGYMWPRQSVNVLRDSSRVVLLRC